MSENFEIAITQSPDPDKDVQISHTRNGHQWRSWQFTAQEARALLRAMMEEIPKIEQEVPAPP